MAQTLTLAEPSAARKSQEQARARQIPPLWTPFGAVHYMSTHACPATHNSAAGQGPEGMRMWTVRLTKNADSAASHRRPKLEAVQGPTKSRTEKRTPL